MDYITATCLQVNLENLVKKHWDVDSRSTQVVFTNENLAVKRINIQKIHHNKTLHLFIDINNHTWNVVDIGTSMLITLASVVRELELMYLVTRHESCQTTSSVDVKHGQDQ